MKYLIGTKFGKNKYFDVNGNIKYYEDLIIIGFYEFSKQYWLIMIPAQNSLMKKEEFYSIPEQQLEWFVSSNHWTLL